MRIRTRRSPMHHLAGWSYPHSALALGQTTVLVDGFDPETVLELIERERVTYANFVPLHFIRIAALDPAVTNRFDLSPVGVERPVGERGLVYLAPNAGVRFTYRGDPEGSAAIWRDDLFTLGDIGYLDDDGFLYLVDRAKDVIVTGGANVYPAEVETVLREHPRVREVAVIGVPDAEWGERVHAVVSARGAVDTDELLSLCRERLVKAKCPSSIEFVDALPRDPMGKVRKRELREPHWAGESRRI